MEQLVYSEPYRVSVPDCLMAVASRSGTEPENEVITFLETWASQKGVNPAKAVKFGYDVPVAEEQKKQGLRGYEYLLQVPDHVKADDEVKVEQFLGGRFVALDIADPFADPFNRIPQGWETLVRHIRENNIAVNWCAPRSCLEEVTEKNGTCHMTVMIRLA